MFKTLGLLFCLFISNAFAARPAWLNSPGEFCGNRKICAVGESTGRMMAETEARNGIAKVFETRISAKTTVTSTAESTVIDDVVSGKVDENYHSQIQEVTEQALEGIEIIEYFEDSDAFFVLASLDKGKAALHIKNKMDELDTEIENNYKLDKRSSLYKALKLFKVRDHLNNKFSFLTGRNYIAKIKKIKILEAKRKKRAKKVVVLLKMNVFTKSNELKSLIIEELLKNDLSVVTVPTLKHHFIVSVNLTKEKQHLNVEGFEKYKFLINFISSDLSGKEIGRISLGHTVTGRSQGHAFESALGKIKEFTITNIGELNID